MSTTNPIMKPEEKAWHDLRTAASVRLRSGFAGRVLAAARGPGPGVWATLREAAAACLRPGFAARVLRAARGATVPSYASQFALSAATVALCLAAVLFLHQRNQRLADERNLAEWRAIVAFAQEIDVPGR